MGFKHIQLEELETSHSPIFVGAPLKEGKYTIEAKKIGVESEENLRFLYQNNMERINVIGKGAIKINNTSFSDRLWNIHLRLVNPGNIATNLDSELSFESLDPNATKTIEYDLKNAKTIPDPLKVREKTEIHTTEYNLNNNERRNSNKGMKENYVIVVGKENVLKYTISVENITTYIISNLSLSKIFSKDFYDVRSSNDINFENERLTWKIPQLMPGEKKYLSFFIKIKPLKKGKFGTGNINISGNFLQIENTFSGISIEDFLAYSFARHSIRVKEDETTPNKWDCSLIFKNNSEFEMMLLSAQVLDKSKSNQFFNSEIYTIVSPNENYTSGIWRIDTEKEPKFLRKIKYTVLYDVKNVSKFQIGIAENVFDLVNIDYKREFSEVYLVQSERLKLKELQIDNLIRIKNVGTIPINGFKLKESIPRECILLYGKSIFEITNSSGLSFAENFTVQIDTSELRFTDHYTIELSINIDKIGSQYLIDQNESLEIRFPLYLVSPNYKKDYRFPTEIITYFPKYRDGKSQNLNAYYSSKITVPVSESSILKLDDLQKSLVFHKEIHPSKTDNECTSILRITNDSDEAIKDLSLLDEIVKPFELISSSPKHELIRRNREGNHEVVFRKENLLPHEEVEIKCRLRNASKIMINYSEVESFIYELGSQISPTTSELIEFDKFKKTEKRVDIVNTEDLKFYYDKEGNIKNLSGKGVIKIINNSTIDSIWNTQLKLSGPQLSNLRLPEKIDFDTLQPGASKTINYDIGSLKSLPSPIKITEKVKILNLGTRNVKYFDKYRNVKWIELLAKKKLDATTEVKEKLESKIAEGRSKIGINQKKLSKTIELIEEWKIKEDEQKEILEKLEEDYRIVIKEKQNKIRKKLMDLFNKNEVTTPEEEQLMINEIKDRINNRISEKKKFTADNQVKEVALISEINEKYDPRIKEIEDTLKSQETTLNELTSAIEQEGAKIKNYDDLIKDLKKKHANLVNNKSKNFTRMLKVLSENKKNRLKVSSNQTKENKAQIEKEFTNKLTAVKNEIDKKFIPQIEALEEDLDNKKLELKEINALVNKKISTRDKIKTNVKDLINRGEDLIKEKNKILTQEIKKLSKETKDTIKEIDNQIEEEEKEITKINLQTQKEVEIEKKIAEKHDPRIRKLKSKLDFERENYIVFSRKVKEYIEQKSKLKTLLSSLKQENEILIKETEKVEEDLQLILEKKSGDLTENERNFLIFGMENILKFTIRVENTSSFSFENLIVTKDIPKEFYSFKSNKRIQFDGTRVQWEIPLLKPGDVNIIYFFVRIETKKRSNIVTGNIEIYGKILSTTNNYLSGFEINKFSAYSRAIHQIKIKDKKRYRKCSLVFNNFSDFNLILNSLVVFHKSHDNKLLNLTLNELITSGEQYTSNSWEIDDLEPEFMRRVDYCVNHEFINSGTIQIIIEQKPFEIVDLQFEKQYSEMVLAQSSRLKLQESIVNNYIRITNTGSTPIDGILVKEIIPKDIVPPTKSSDIVVKKSSRGFFVDNFLLRITPPDIDVSIPHTLEILINVSEKMKEQLLDVDESLEISYPLSIFSPDYRNMYEINTEITSYLSKYQDLTSTLIDSYYYTTHTLPKEDLPLLRVGRSRQNLEIDKCVYTGKNANEFIINISINNVTDMKVNDIKILDVIPKYFKLISSNIDYKTEDLVSKDEYWITFYIQKIMPKEKIEIRYKIENLTDQKIDFSEIEPLIFN